MRNKNTFRIVLGLALALVCGIATFAGVQAGPVNQTDTPEGQDCQECHPTLYLSWQESAHGQALVDPTFQTMWKEQGNPRECLLCHTTGYDSKTNTWVADGITCQACHSPIPENHPLQPMPTDHSAALCEECHSQTVFEWKISKHREAGLDCVDCHGQHSTTLRAEDAAELCASCHRERASNFAHSEHSMQELSCPDCHLEVLDDELAGMQGHSEKDHSFRPKLTACNECHKYQMHDPSQVHAQGGAEDITRPEESRETQGISIEPDPVNPISFALLSALIGMAAGLLLAPWIQEWYHKIEFSIKTEGNQEGEDE